MKMFWSNVITFKHKHTSAEACLRLTQYSLVINLVVVFVTLTTFVWSGIVALLLMYFCPTNKKLVQEKMLLSCAFTCSPRSPVNNIEESPNGHLWGKQGQSLDRALLLKLSILRGELFVKCQQELKLYFMQKKSDVCTSGMLWSNSIIIVVTLQPDIRTVER